MAGRAGDAGTIQSSRCQINLAKSSIADFGNTLFIDIDVTFLSGKVGTVNNYFYAVDRGNQNTGFPQVGQWTIGTPSPGGLVSWWKGEGNTVDSVGSNSGSWSGTTSYEPGTSNQSLKFMGKSYKGGAATPRVTRDYYAADAVSPNTLANCSGLLKQVSVTPLDGFGALSINQYDCKGRAGKR